MAKEGLTLLDAAEALSDRRVSSVELTRAALDRIEREDRSINSFIAVLPEYALDRAAQADRELSAGAVRGPLHGIPVAVKDLIHMRGIRTTGGARIYEDVPAAENAAVVEKLEAAGAVILGKLNLHELAYGVTSENPHYGSVHNPWNLGHSAGGSSGGSGAAVATGFAFATLGTDTGGSIRIPASFCGVVGFKPTYGLVSRHGVQTLGFSLDHVGPLARTVRDTATVLTAIAGYDHRDPASAKASVADYIPPEGCSIRGIRLGFPETWLSEHVDREVAEAVRSAVSRAASLEAEVISVNIPNLEAVNTVGQVLLLAEAAALLERFLDRRERFGPDVLALLDQGRLLPATDYVNAQRLRRQFQSDFQALWNQVDCIVTPATPVASPRLGQTTVRIEETEELVRPLATRFSRPMNVLGVPAIAMPCGLSGDGLPIGLQIAAPPFQEALVLRVAAALEDAGVGIPPQDKMQRAR
ncbi:MAG TPA: amidase [Bryobacteraceae bacterium]|jgi:aspartyl-tRNA(Asn)/glutamyl-tRNA(Gln) amidotransferase subunit A